MCSHPMDKDTSTANHSCQWLFCWRKSAAVSIMPSHVLCPFSVADVTSFALHWLFGPIDATVLLAALLRIHLLQQSDCPSIRFLDELCHDFVRSSAMRIVLAGQSTNTSVPILHTCSCCCYASAQACSHLQPPFFQALLLCTHWQQLQQLCSTQTIAELCSMPWWECCGVGQWQG